MSSRTGLQWTLGLLTGLPAGSAVLEILKGPQSVPGGSPAVAPPVDSALRYASVFKLAAALVIWSQLSRIERSPSATLAAATIGVGGLARLWSRVDRGARNTRVAAQRYQTLTIIQTTPRSAT